MKIFILFLVIIIKLIFYSNTAVSKIVEDKIIIGATLSMTGQNSSQNLLYKDQFDRAIKSINSLGGVNVGGKSYQFEIIYYDNESNTSRANKLITRLIQNDGVQYLIILKNEKLFNPVKSLIENDQISIARSYEAVSIYKKAFEAVNSVDSKKIKNFILNNR
tara:strand:+ start:190 stop:675 length:486 start_codon:yes stop_codon:yes gene_type:complete